MIENTPGPVDQDCGTLAYQELGATIVPGLWSSLSTDQFQQGYQACASAPGTSKSAVQWINSLWYKVPGPAYKLFSWELKKTVRSHPGLFSWTVLGLSKILFTSQSPQYMHVSGLHLRHLAERIKGTLDSTLSKIFLAYQELGMAVTAIVLLKLVGR